MHEQAEWSELRHRFVGLAPNSRSSNKGAQSSSGVVL